jgi:hypothetical protein
MNPLSNILKQRERGCWDFSIYFFIGSSWVHLVMVSNWNCQMFYVLLYIVYSNCYFHPMCHYVSSCHVHPDMLFYSEFIWSWSLTGIVRCYGDLVGGVVAYHNIWFCANSDCTVCPSGWINSTGQRMEPWPDELTMSRWKSKWKNLNNPFLAVLICCLADSYVKVHLAMTSNQILRDGVGP